MLLCFVRSSVLVSLPRSAFMMLMESRRAKRERKKKREGEEERPPWVFCCSIDPTLIGRAREAGTKEGTKKKGRAGPPSSCSLVALRAMLSTAKGSIRRDRFYPFFLFGSCCCCCCHATLAVFLTLESACRQDERDLLISYGECIIHAGRVRLA